MKCEYIQYTTSPTRSGFPVVGVILASLMAITLLLAAPTWANPPGHGARVSNQDEGEQPKLSKQFVTIEKKSLKHIYTIGKGFAVNGETLILGIDGKEVSIKKMLVPCDAEVSYLFENGTRTAKRIEIKRVAAGASWQWTSEHPE